MRDTRKSESVNRMEHETYAFYPLPQHITNHEEAVAWGGAGRGSVRHAMRLFTSREDYQEEPAPLHEQ